MVYFLAHLLTATFLFCLAPVTVSESRDKVENRFWFQYNGHMLAHPQKAFKGGQDAFFASDQLLVVSDGVGGWNKQGVDPSQYSKFLCSAAQVYHSEDKPFYNKNPGKLIAKAQSKNKEVGSATMAVLTLDGHSLRGCYIGDSGFVVLRQIRGPQKEAKLHMIFRFVEQQHDFNFPFQLSQQQYNGDDPTDSICVAIDIRENDIVVLGSDGFFDNVYDDQITLTIESALREEEDPRKQSQILLKLPKVFAEQAIERGKSEDFVSPFQKRAQELGRKHRGGKLDDTTVIISRVTSIKRDEKILSDSDQEL